MLCKKPQLLIALACAFLVSTADAGRTKFSGFAELETRLFPHSPQFAGQESGLGLSLAVQPEYRWRSDDRDNRLTLIPFARIDRHDPERSHFDLREAHWLHLNDDWEFLVGVNKVFWGVAESRHLVDIINQTDNVEDIDGEDKLGQPMLQFTLVKDWGIVSAFALPGFRERTFAGLNGRLRSPLPVDDDQALYHNGASDERVDFALRYSHTLEDYDIGLAYFHGVGREPRLLPNAARTRLIPNYDLINQFSLDLQLTREAWLWKFEGLIREGQGETFGALVGGFEYTLYQIHKAWDLGLLFEYHQDNRSNFAPGTLFDNDLFFGARLALNDIQDTSFLAGVVVDRKTDEWTFNLEAERRLFDDWKLELRARFFQNAQPTGLLSAFSDDDYVQLSLFRYF